MNGIKAMNKKMRNEIKKYFFNRHSEVILNPVQDQQKQKAADQNLNDYLYYYQKASRWK